MVDEGDERQETPEEVDNLIQWWSSDEFEERLTNCFAEGKRKAIEERESWLKANGKNALGKSEAELSTEQNAAIQRFSSPEFEKEVTRLFGEAKDRAIQQRDRLMSDQQSQSEQ
jgi:hypothetical protein